MQGLLKWGPGACPRAAARLHVHVSEPERVVETGASRLDPEGEGLPAVPRINGTWPGASATVSAVGPGA